MVDGGHGWVGVNAFRTGTGRTGEEAKADSGSDATDVEPGVTVVGDLAEPTTERAEANYIALRAAASEGG